MMLRWIVPEWPAPHWLRALTTTRVGGVSTGSYDGLNIASHVGDAGSTVSENRRLLRQFARLPSEPLWLNQVHGTTIVDAASAVAGATADGSYTAVTGIVCCAQTADCLPVLLCDVERRRVGVVHGGWRGLVGGAIERYLETSASEPATVMAWLGPAIGPRAFEVGPEVRDAFMGRYPATEVCFKPGRDDRLWADIYAVARTILIQSGVSEAAVFGGSWCTVQQSRWFYSYRREGTTGRMATLIWMEE